MSIRKPYLEGYLLSKENLKLSEFDFMLFSFVFGGTSSKSFVMYILSVDLLQYAVFGSFCQFFFFLGRRLTWINLCPLTLIKKYE